jgi:hypothetical protein
MRSFWQTLDLKPEVGERAGVSVAALPRGAAGQWCRLRVCVPGAQNWWAQVALTDPTRGQVVRSVFLGPARVAARGGKYRETILHVPGAATSVTLRLFGAPSSAALLSVALLARWAATSYLLWRGRHLLAGSVRGAPLGLIGRLRANLGQAPARGGEAPPYAVWIALCESALAPPPFAAPLDVQIAVFGNSATDTAHRRILTVEDWALITAPWVVVLQAGEVLAPQARAWFSWAAAAHPNAVCITADFDRRAPDDSRHDPVFLPGADPLVVRSGLPAAGPCAMRWTALPSGFDPSRGARAWRQARLAACTADDMIHIPRILAHLPPDAPTVFAAPAPRRRESDFAPSITALVPSQARSMHVAHCLRRMQTGTTTPNLRLDVLLSAPARAKARVLRRLQAIPHLTLRASPMQNFNYASINNAAAASADSDFLLLLNDDVVPRASDWLSAMVAHMQDPRVGIVGARLIYGNGMVQHEGVILGLADLCENAGRLRPAGDPGPHGIGLVSRQVSAVTAACMLVRTSLYRDIGGMDEGFAIALNDVDFCLRAGQAGWRIVYCAEALLMHYESLSLGRHYAGARAALESVEVRRLRDRWGTVIAADPHYNPQASLDLGREWQPAFCPRPFPP